MNPAALQAALAGRRQFVDENSVSGYGASNPGAAAPAGTSKAPVAASRELYSGQYIDRPASGYAGLLNQGATCYLNSLLQSLYMCPEFRRALYEWKYKDVEDEQKHSIPLQLQKLFARLQVSIRGACETKPLTVSFGWNMNEAFVQHDVVELMNVLFESLEAFSSPGEKINDFIANQVAGKLTDYIQCKQCSNTRSRLDRFTSIALPIKGMKTLENSFAAFGNAEVIEGVNCDVCDKKTDAMKGMALAELPYVLFIQLNRFEFSYETFDKVKLKDELKFPEILDLGPFIRTTTPEVARFELFSVLIHTGGAGGGHYFAYIKSFANKKWFKFDDSNVTELSQKDVDRMFKDKAEIEREEKEKEKEKGGASTDPTSPPEAPAVPSAPSPPKVGPPKAPKATELLNVQANAYMLVYRRLDSKNLDSVADSAIPEHLKSDITKEDDAFKVQKAEFERQRNLIRFRVKYHDEFHVVEVKKDETFEKALQTVYEQLKVADSGFPMERVRLRELDTLKNVAGRPFDVVAADLVGTFNFPDNKNMILETRADGESFPEYDINDLVFRISELDAETKEYKESIQVGVPQHAVVKHLRSAVAAKLKLSPQCIRMVYIADNSAVNLIKDEEALIADLRLAKGEEIKVERCENFVEGNSLIIQKFTDSLNIVNIVFNSPGKEDMDHKLEVDLRYTLRHLREQIAPVIDRPVDSFRVFKTTELKDLDKLLLNYGFKNGEEIFILEGKPLTPKEFLFKAYIWDETIKPPAEPLRYTGDVVLNEDWEMSKVKAEVSSVCGLPASKIRLRDRLGFRLTNVYVDSLSLKQNCKGMTDFKEIVVQEIFHEESLTQDHLLLNVMVWEPQEFTLSPPREIGLLKTSTIDECKAELASIYDIPFEHIRVAHPLGYQLKELKNIPLLDWEGNELPEKASLGGKPWSMKHGEHLVIKDNRKSERIVKSKEDGSPTVKAPPARDEPKFKIYSAEERKENERKKAEAEAAAKAEEEKARELRETAKQAADKAANP